jgi:hypothetical protein
MRRSRSSCPILHNLSVNSCETYRRQCAEYRDSESPGKRGSLRHMCADFADEVGNYRLNLGGGIMVVAQQRGSIVDVVRLLALGSVV